MSASDEAEHDASAEPGRWVRKVLDDRRRAPTSAWVCESVWMTSNEREQNTDRVSASRKHTMNVDKARDLLSAAASMMRAGEVPAEGSGGAGQWWVQRDVPSAFLLQRDEERLEVDMDDIKYPDRGSATVRYHRELHVLSATMSVMVKLRLAAPKPRAGR